MSHSRIFQISSKPIKKKDYIEESNYYDHWFTNSIADYVSDISDEDRPSEIKELKEFTKDSLVINGNKVTVKCKNNYFARKYETMLNQAKKLTKTTLDEFSGNAESYTDMELYILKQAYDDKFGFYVDDTGEYFGLITLDKYIRSLNDGDTFYIGAVIDYHF